MVQKDKGFVGSLILLALALLIAGYFLFSSMSSTKQDTPLNQTSDQADSQITPNQQPFSDTRADIPSNWAKNIIGKPLEISFYTPREFTVEKDGQGSETWSVNIISPDKLQLALCVGCQLTSSIKTCGNSSAEPEKYLCETKLNREFRNGSYSLEVFKKSNGENFAQITGGVYKDSGENVPLRVTTEDNRMPSKQELETLDIIISSIR